MLRQWKEYFEELMNGESKRDKRLDEAEMVNQEVQQLAQKKLKQL